ncbi:7-cyano-7-deazaguanine synthase QueC [Thermodesulforhabdus norvegica]|uniref:7-cyano-7-deazaguanine synthase n=1 Tax=Thermodesulforhabdus norvegica TaxID=39841 RepID=A0A1I4SMJ8_9BACT|nr:7-cyano-7-deazaguanine synthase QueC [Thermodesulforhabdus norvegica]SFM65649.1 preQ(0) biosynthesis protein QueC [Thermodesulforhabdus norvegica]
MNRSRAVVLLSGGIDSTTTLAVAKHQGYELYALTFRYGQRHEKEIQSARRLARVFGVKKHLILEIPLHLIGASALTDDIPVPKDVPQDKIGRNVPITYVPGRNTIFLACAVAWGETVGAYDIFIGANALDYSGYPDCRPEFIEAFEKVANLGTRAGSEEGQRFRIHAPLISLSKKEIILKGISLGVDYALTHSCYDPDPQGRACGRCESCILRRKGFKEAGIPDPTIYAEEQQK